MDAEERALSVADLGGDVSWDKCTEQIKKAEQAARLDEHSRVVQLLIDYGYGKPVTMELLKAIRALAEEVT